MAAIETRQGTLSIAFQSFKFGDSVPEPNLCDLAENKLMTVLELDGKHEN